MPPLFGRSKSVLTTSAELATVEANNNSVPLIRKSKSFKRIRGLLKVGESRRERRARKEAERLGTTTATSSSSAATGGTTSDQATTPISTNRTGVSTVMDTSFISTATSNLQDLDDVSTINYYNVDVDDRSVITQSTVGNNLFGTSHDESGNTGVASTSASSNYSILKVVLLLMDPETRRFELLQLEFDSLKAYVSDVLAQIPISVTEDALRKQTYTGIAGNNGINMEPHKLLATFCKGNEVLVAIPDGVAASECTRLARPILSDANVVEMLQSSGIDPTGWKEDPTMKKAIKKKSSLKNQTNGGTSRDAEPDISLQAEPLDAKISKSGGSVFSTIIIMVLIALILQVFHIYISAPINLGSTISPGIWLSKCGLLSVVPTYCTDNAYVHFNRNGTTSYYNSEKILVWTMDGTVCPEIDENDTSSNKVAASATNCIRGMHVQADGKIYIGGKHITHVTYHNSKNGVVPLTPWPFVDAPKVKVWKK